MLKCLPILFAETFFPLIFDTSKTSSLDGVAVSKLVIFLFSITSNIASKMIAPSYELVGYFIADSAAFSGWVSADSIDVDHAVLDKIVGN